MTPLAFRVWAYCVTFVCSLWILFIFYYDSELIKQCIVEPYFLYV